MASVDEERIERLVRELDDIVPRDGGWVRLEQYGGGPDEGRMVANQAGYLRLGIELLKGALAPAPESTSEPFPIDVGLRPLLTDDSTIGFDEFIRDENAPPSPEISMGGTGAMLVGCGCVAVVIATIAFAAIGVHAVIWGW